MSAHPWPQRARQAAWAVPLALGLAGCATPGSAPQPLALATAASAGLQASATTTPWPQQAWWQALGDARLNNLMDQALANSPTLALASARLARAQQGVDALQAAQGPQAGLGADATRQHYTAKGLVPPPVAGHVYTNGSVQASGSIELDFFGKHQAALAAALGQARAAQADQQAARVLLATQVARSWVALGRLVALREVAQRTLDQRLALQGLISQRVKAGLDTQIDQRQTDGTVHDAQGQLAALDGQMATARHQLAVLSGQAPQALADWSPRLAANPQPALPGQLGADLLGRRADVVAARWRVEASMQDVALARTQFYPDINLVGFVGLNALGLDNLLNLNARNFGAGPALRLPLFDGGRLRANLRGKAADADAAVASYNALVLDAVREAADAVALLLSLRQQQVQQGAAQAAAVQAWRLAEQRFEAGLGTRLQVLAAESAVLAQRQANVDLFARALDAHLALVRALGGGWAGEAVAPAMATTPAAAS